MSGNVQWLDASGLLLLDTLRLTDEQVILLAEEGLPELATVGQAADVGSSGLRVLSGPLNLRAGAYSNTLSLFGKDETFLRPLLHEAIEAARDARFIRCNGRDLRLTGDVRMAPKWRVPTRRTLSQFGVTFQAASPYWLSPVETTALSAGANTVMIEGDGPVHPRLTLTATAAVTDPQITTDAGVTRVLITLAPSDVLTIDAMPGVWSVTRNGLDALLDQRGPLPLLERGLRVVTLGPGLTGTLDYRPGVTSPDGQLPLFGPE